MPATSGLAARHARSSSTDVPRAARGPANTSRPSKPWARRSSAHSPSAKSRFLCRKSVPRQSRNGAPASAGRRRRLGLGDDDAVVDAERHEPRALVVDEVLAARVAQRVRREEDDAVGERERHPGQLAVAGPLRVVVEVGGVVVGDRVVLGEHDAPAEPAQQQQVLRRGHLVGPVHDVGRHGVVVDLVVPDPLDAERVELGARRVAQRARDRHPQAHVLAARELADQLEREHLRAGERRAEGGAVDRHRERADASRAAASERASGIDSERAASCTTRA